MLLLRMITWTLGIASIAFGPPGKVNVVAAGALPIGATLKPALTTSTTEAHVWNRQNSIFISFSGLTLNVSEHLLIDFHLLPTSPLTLAPHC